MQKVVGSSPIIRSLEGPGNGAFLAGSGSLDRFLDGQKVDLAAHCCPIERRIVGVPLRLRHPLAPRRCLRVHPQREPRVLMAELRGRVADVIAARAPQARVGAPQAVERQMPDRRDARLGELHVRRLDRGREHVAAEAPRLRVAFRGLETGVRVRFPLPSVGENVYSDDYTRVVTIR